MNSRGFVLDTLTMTISLMVMVALIILFATYMSTQNDNVQSSTLDSTFKSTYSTSSSGMMGAMDKGLLVGIVLLVSALLYFAYTIGTNPGYFILFLLLNIMVLFVIPIAESYLIASFYNNSYAVAVANMPALFTIVNNYTIFITGISVLLLIALFIPKQGAYGA